ncbi:MAG: hypothetical protein E7319_06600 [Clostridiales bacterium]|nr:hypothetical protein [Clostridiales bacterium]
MLQTIKKHPLGFLHSMSWVGAGATMLYSMRYESAGYPEALFAEAAVILFLVCCGVFLLTPLIGLIIKLVRKQRPSVTQECHFVSAAAKWYESTRSDFFWYYVIIVLVPILPIAALLLPAQEQYIACVFIITIGISIWLCFVLTEMPATRLLKVRDTEDRFDIRVGASAEQMDALHAGDTFGLSKRLWASRRDYLYNMLLKEEVIDQRDRITCYDLPVSTLAAHYRLKQDSFREEDVIWIPLAQFFHRKSTKGFQVIQKLFTHSLSDIANLRFQNNRSSNPEDYHHSSTDLRLEPDEDAVLCVHKNVTRLFAATAQEGNRLYHGCMLLIKGARLDGVKWDRFENLATGPIGDGESADDDLNPQQAQTFYDLLLKGAFPYTLCSLTYHEQEKKLALEIWTEPAEPGKVNRQVAAFTSDDGLNYWLVLSYDELKWYWMNSATMDASPRFY